MKKDIETRNDIELLINTFYDKVKTDPVIGYIFTDVAKVNWEKHLPVMYSFWENVLFQTGGYAGNPLKTHTDLNKVTPLEPEHFAQWNKIFSSVLDELFEGRNATLARQRAQSISTIIQIKIMKP